MRTTIIAACIIAAATATACAPPRAAEDDGPACARLASGERVTMPLWAVERPAVRLPDTACMELYR